MTFDEALQVLGVSLPEGQASVRPAYLRLLRKHRPERDPEGFKRLREAFELVEAQPWRFSHSSSELPLATVGADPSAVFDDSIPPGAAGPASGASTRIDPVSELRAQIFACDDEAERLRLAEAGAARIQTPDAYELWVEAADEAGDSASAERALREACDLGFGERFLPQLRLQFASGLSEAELETWLNAAREALDPSWFALARELLVRERGAEATELGLRVLAWQTEHGALEEWTAVRFGLQLFERAESADAARYAEQLLALRDPFSHVEPVLFAVLRDLLRVHAELGSALTRAIAAALSSQNPCQVDADFAVLCSSDKQRARNLAKRLARDAPTLYTVYKRDLPAFGMDRLRDLRNTARTGFWRFTTSGWVVFALVSSLRVCTVMFRPGAVPETKVEFSFSHTAQGRSFYNCVPTNESFCRAAQTLLQEPDCSQTQADALYALVAARRALGSRLDLGGRHWFDGVISKAKSVCHSTIEYP